jgi:hypothetical protein
MSEPISTLLAQWYRWRLHRTDELDRMDPQATRMRAVDEAIEGLPELQGIMVRSMAARRDLGSPQGHYIGGGWASPHGSEHLRQLEHEALAALVNRLRRAGVIEASR